CLGFSGGPASNMTTFSPPSVSTLAAVPPPAPDPMMQTSYSFGELTTCDIETSFPSHPCGLHARGRVDPRTGSIRDSRDCNNSLLTWLGSQTRPLRLAHRHNIM